MSNSTKFAVKRQYLSDFSTSKRDLKWDKHRADTQNVEAIFKDGDEFHTKQSARLNQCSGSLLFHRLADTETGEETIKLFRARFCHVRSCPVCQWRRSQAWQRRMFLSMNPISEQFPTHRWLFLTLTVKNVPVNELNATIKHMQKSWQRLHQLKAFPSVGYIKALEVTRGKDGSAHPHFHILMLVPSGYFSGRAYINQQTWRELWMQSLRADYLPVVDVRAVKSKNPEKPHDVSGAVVETLKYEMKIADLEKYPEFLRDMAKQLVRVRSIEVGGVLKDYLKSEEPTDEELIGNTDEDTLEDLKKSFVMNWDRTEKRYIKN